MNAEYVAAHGCTSLRLYGDGWRCIECFAPYEVEPAWCIQTGGPATECLVCRKQDERDKRKHAARQRRRGHAMRVFDNSRWALIAQQHLEENTKGCCRDEKWRGRLCPYHDAYEDGLFTMLALLDERHIDGTGA